MNADRGLGMFDRAVGRDRQRRHDPQTGPCGYRRSSAFIGGFKAFCFLSALLFANGAWAQEPDDPFRYLEDAADPRTQEFFREQAARARAALDAIPGRA